jgi:hypothetical protein
MKVNESEQDAQICCVMLTGGGVNPYYTAYLTEISGSISRRNLPVCRKTESIRKHLRNPGETPEKGRVSFPGFLALPVPTFGGHGPESNIPTPNLPDERTARCVSLIINNLNIFL